MHTVMNFFVYGYGSHPVRLPVYFYTVAVILTTVSDNIPVRLPKNS